MINMKKGRLMDIILVPFSIVIHPFIWRVASSIFVVGIGAPSKIFLRTYRPEDIDWIIYRHKQLYADEYGWDETFGALVTKILSTFMHHHDDKREQIWIAEQDGERIGTVMIADAGNRIAQLRLFLVEPHARNKGVGTHLIDTCIHFCRKNRYTKIRLWTQGNLYAARHLYAKAGFVIIEQAQTKSFGYDLIEETWELSLKNLPKISK